MLTEGTVRVLGTMSGTSLDGVDVAVIETDGITIAGFGESAYRRYEPEERELLRAALGRWPGETREAEAAEVVEDVHAEVMAGLAGKVELAGFHGQTLAHDPGGRGTYQAGNGAKLARELGLPVVWDFRTADVAAGGQGAPLAPAYHFALAKWLGAEAPLAFLNLGGVGNLTWVDPRLDRVEEAGAVLAFDTGPANAPLNDLMQARLGLAFDEGGALAAQGTADATVLTRFAAHPWFEVAPPKSLDRDDFATLMAQVAPLDNADAAATLTAAAALSVCRGAEFFPAPVARVLVTGGGRLNPVLMAGIAEGLGVPVDAVEAVGLDGDMIEAQAFAYLAVRSARGLALTFPATTGVAAPLTGGRVSLPDD
ncbi:anhydro-N-acetylmuramic acid kinase [Tropicimonas sp. IMCC34043]|uniref:anhydro-N-acetylmuramic acid kinase n=1 Tax=Tropicimonas sp. IMCC34043 TaxID=2248760 RepID=UPI000E287A49|nr:anhydro-N-acetylmuramic acid kinase [Tropicimonas sp. IMCC34043]